MRQKLITMIFFKGSFLFIICTLQMKKHSKKTIFKGSIFNLKNYVSTDDMQLHHWYNKASELALTLGKKKDYQILKIIEKKRKEIFEEIRRL